MMDEELEVKPLDFHRQVSLHVLSNLPVKPDRAESLPWPIAFLTDKCKNSEDEIKYSNREKRVSKTIFGWRNGLDKVLCDEIKKIIKPIETSDGTINSPLVVRAQSGFGKSILIGKIVAELISAREELDKDSKWPIFDRILFSQLKDSEYDELELSICKGLDLSHRCKTFEDLSSGIEEDKKIIFIDSLDEHSDKINWWKVTHKLSQLGWLIVWTCRDPDWGHHKLGDSEDEGGPIPNQIFRELLEKENDQIEKLSWNRFHGRNWSLAIGDHANNLIELINNENDDDRRFVEYCYSNTQLMHIFNTNFTINSKVREKLQKNLVEKLLHNKNEQLEKFSGKDFEIFTNDQWSNDLFTSNLVRIIIQTALDLISLKSEFTELDIDLLWKDICKKYNKKETVHRKESELNELLNVEDLSYNEEALFNYLKVYGIFRDKNKFRHRDFATIAFIEGSGNRGLVDMDSNHKNDILFQPYFPNIVLENNRKDFKTENGRLIIEEFLRRNGNILVHLDPINNFIDEYTLNKSNHDSLKDYYIPIRSMEIHGIILKKDTDDLSNSQIEALTLGRGSHNSIVLKGFPGTGKTYTGVEAIIIRQASLYRSGRTDAYSLIVALNDQLANSISRELEDSHKFSKYLESIILFFLKIFDRIFWSQSP